MIGQRVPDITFKTRVKDEEEGFGWKDVTTCDYFKGKSVILFSLPGAFTPTCSTYQLPNFEKKFAEFSLEGIYQDIFIPNVFTPNGDYKNDVLSISGIKDCESSVLRIFNRWGEEVFYTNVMTEYWDGYYQGKLAQIDGYSWEIRYSDYNNTQHKKVGFICVAK